MEQVRQDQPTAAELFCQAENGDWFAFEALVERLLVTRGL